MIYQYMNFNMSQLVRLEGKHTTQNARCALLTLHPGHSCKIGNMRCPGTLKNQNPQFEEKKISFFAFLCFYIPSKEEKIMGHLI